jgi:hypothetical protein
MEIAELEARQPMPSAISRITTNRSTGCWAGVARGADDHRHTDPARREQHLLEIVRLPRQRAGRRIRGERSRPTSSLPESAAM